MDRGTDAPGAGGAAPGAGNVGYGDATEHPTAGDAPSASAFSPPDRTVGILFEHRGGGGIWRLEVTRFEGRTIVHWRKWYMRDGEMTPTKTGVTIPLERFPELAAALCHWIKNNLLGEAPDQS